MDYCKRTVRRELYLYQKRLGLFRVGALVSGRWDPPHPHVGPGAEAEESEDESETATIVGIMEEWEDDAIFDLSGFEGITVQHDAGVAWSDTDPVRFMRVRVVEESKLRHEDVHLRQELAPCLGPLAGYWLRQREESGSDSSESSSASPPLSPSLVAMGLSSVSSGNGALLPRIEPGSPSGSA